VYQKIIVPGLLLELHVKYGDQIARLLGEEATSDLYSCSTYEQLHRYFFSKLMDTGGEDAASHESFDKWKLCQEGWTRRQAVSTPLLLISALDDPFHHPDLIGLDPEPSNPNIVYLLTENGGHVGWPVGLLEQQAFIPAAIGDFCSTCSLVE
jgi:hypothetical protein